MNIFDQIQNEIVNMDLESMVSILNECFVSLDKLHEQFPEVKQNTNRIFSNNTCIIDKNCIDFLNLVFQSYGVNTNNYMLQNIQKGGMDGNDDLMIEDVPSKPNQNLSTTNVSYRQQPSGQQLLISPNMLGNNTVSILSSSLQYGLTPEAQLKIIEALSKAVETESSIKLRTAEIENNIKLSDERFKNILRYSSLIISSSTPAALMYYFKELINNSAISTVSALGNTTANVSGNVELFVRNTPSYLVSSFLSAGKMLKLQMGDNFPSILTKFGKTIQESGITSIASESITAQMIESTTSGILSTTDAATMIGCIIIYIGGVIVLNLLFYIIFILYTSEDIGISIGVPGVAKFYIKKKLNGGRKTIKHSRKKYRKSHKKYTHKRH